LGYYAIIYFLQKKFGPTEEGIMKSIINGSDPTLSVITEIELLCWKSPSPNEMTLLKGFIGDCYVFELDRQVKLKTIEIRRDYGLKLPDAIIAATALTFDLTLISNDKKGFNKIAALEVLNPFAEN